VVQIDNWQAGRLLDNKAAQTYLTAKENAAKEDTLTSEIIANLALIINDKKKKFIMPSKGDILAAAYAKKNKDHTATVFTCWCFYCTYAPFSVAAIRAPSNVLSALFFSLLSSFSAWSRAVSRYIILQKNGDSSTQLHWYAMFQSKGKKTFELRPEGSATILRRANTDVSYTSTVALCSKFKLIPDIIIPAQVKKRVSGG